MIPFATSLKLAKEGGEPTENPYSALVGSLLWLTVCTRPDLAYAVGVLTRHMSAPTEAAWQAALGVVRYLIGTRDAGLVYGPASPLVGYADADFGGDTESRRSTTGYVFLLNGAAITWASRLQPTVACSTAEAEYMAASSAVREALWLQKSLLDFDASVPKVMILGDNQAALKLLANPIASQRSKHIEIMHHFARERVERGEVEFRYTETDKQVADILTKPLAENKFTLFRSALGVR